MTIQELAARRTFPTFRLTNLLRSTFAPRPGQKICILIDLPDPTQIKDFAFLKNTELTIQRNAVKFFHEALHNGTMDELGLQGGSDSKAARSLLTRSPEAATLISLIRPSRQKEAP